MRAAYYFLAPPAESDYGLRPPQGRRQTRPVELKSDHQTGFR